MRLVLLAPLLISVAAPAHAQGARESRFGPTSPRQANAAAAARYDGPMLDWSGRRRAAASPAGAGQTPPAPPVQVQGSAPAASPALPTSLYAAPRPAPIVAAGATRVPPAAPRQLAVLAPNTPSARFYSVSRESGLTPDAIPPAGPGRQVLITAQPPPPESQDAAPVHGSADWLAAGVAGDEERDDGARRRAKTRNQDQ